MPGRIELGRTQAVCRRRRCSTRWTAHAERSVSARRRPRSSEVAEGCGELEARGRRRPGGDRRSCGPRGKELVAQCHERPCPVAVERPTALVGECEVDLVAVE